MPEKRSAFLLFINTTPDSASSSYALVGDGVTELSVSCTAQISTEQFAHQDTTNTDLTGYQPNAPVSALVVKGDSAFEYINAIRNSLPIGNDVYTDIVMVDIFEVETTGGYPASKQPVSIRINSCSGTASDPLAIEYVINWCGQGTEGVFNPDAKTFINGINKGEKHEKI